MNIKSNLLNQHNIWILEVLRFYDDYMVNKLNTIDNCTLINQNKNILIVKNKSSYYSHICFVEKKSDIFILRIKIDSLFSENDEEIYNKKKYNEIYVVDIKNENIIKCDISKDEKALALLKCDGFTLQYSQEKNILSYHHMNINNKYMSYYFKDAQNSYKISNKKIELTLNTEKNICDTNQQINLNLIHLKIQYDVSKNIYFLVPLKKEFEELNNIFEAFKLNNKIDLKKIKELIDLIELNTDIEIKNPDIEKFIKDIRNSINKIDKIKNVSRIICHNLKLLNSFNTKINENDTLEDILEKLIKTKNLIYNDNIKEIKEIRNARKFI